MELDVGQTELATLQAQEAFKSWQGQKWLAPRKLLSEGRLELRSALLPFWLFDTTVEVTCTASVGLPVQNAPPDFLRWQQVEETCGQQQHPWTLPNMQVGLSLHVLKNMVPHCRNNALCGQQT